jgi:hypothetical protein
MINLSLPESKNMIHWVDPHSRLGDVGEHKGMPILTPFGVNPQETIMAVAIRAGQYLLENRARYMA